jgi:hypothetical protein
MVDCQFEKPWPWLDTYGMCFVVSMAMVVGVREIGLVETDDDDQVD